MAELEKQKLSSWNSGSVNRACGTCYTVCTFLNITNHFILGRNFSFLPCKEIQEFQVLFLQVAAAVPVTVAVAVAEQVLSVRLRQVQPLHLRVIPFLK